MRPIWISAPFAIIAVVLALIGVIRCLTKSKKGINFAIFGMLFVLLTAFAIIGEQNVVNHKTIQTTNFSKKIDSAQEEFEKRNYESALNILNELRESSKNYDKSADALYLEGMCYFESQDYNTAQKYLEKSYSLSANDECALNLAVAYAKISDDQKAMSMLEKSNFNNDVRTYVMGEIHFGKKDYDDAEKCFAEVISITKDEEIKRSAYISLAMVYKALRHTTDNYVHLTKQIEIMEEAVRELNIEDDLIITEMMSEAYFTAQNYDLALIKFNRLLELGYKRDYIYANIAKIHMQLNDFANAQNVLNEMKQEFPESGICYTMLAFLEIDIQSQKGQEYRNYDKAEEYYELAEKYDASKSGSDFDKLTILINELKAKGWL